MAHLDLLMIRIIQLNKNYKIYQKYLNEAHLTMQMISERDTESKYCIYYIILLFILFSFETLLSINK